MPNWKKVITSGSDATLNQITSSGGIDSPDITIDDWGSVSASLASLDAISNPTFQDVTDNGSTTTNSITISDTASIDYVVTSNISASDGFIVFDGVITTNESVEAALLYGTNLTVQNEVAFNSVPNATTDTDKFIVLDGVNIKYRSGAEVRSDIGAGTSNYTDSDVTDHIDSLNVHSGSHLGTADTDDLPEGSTNLYYTDVRVKTKLNTEGVLSGSSQVDINSTTGDLTTLGTVTSGDVSAILPSGVISGSAQLGIDDTDDVDEGSTNLYYTDARVKTKLNAEGVLSGSNTISGKTLGSNLDNLTVDNTTLQLNSGTTYNGSAARTISAKTGTVANGNTTLVTGDGVYDYVNPISSSIATDINSLETDISGLDNYGEWNLAGEADTTDVTSGKFVKFTGGASITGTGTELNPYVMTITPASSDTASYIDASSPSQGTITIGGNDIDLGLQVGDSPTFTDLTLTGNLTVEGSRTELQVTQLNVEDKNILVASGALNSAAADGAGITIGGANESLTWDHANSRFTFSDDLRVNNSLNIGSVSNAGTDTDKFLVLDSNGNVDYRTGAEVLNDIGGVGSGNGVIGSGFYDDFTFTDTEYHSIARFIDTGEVTGSKEFLFRKTDNTGIGAGLNRHIYLGPGTGSGYHTRYSEDGFVINQANNTDSVAQGGAHVLLTDDPSNNTTLFRIQTDSEQGMTLGTNDVPRIFISGAGDPNNTRVGIGGFAGNSFDANGDTIDDTLHIKGGLKVEKPTTSGTSPGVNFATNVRITGSLIVSASNTFINQGPAEFSGSVSINTTDQVQASTDTDKFLVFDGDQIKYRSGAQVRSDIGATTAQNLQSVTDNGSSTTNVITFPNFVLSTPTNNNAGSDKILVLDGSNRSKIRTRDQLRDDIGALQASRTPQMVVTSAEVLDEALTGVYIPFSGINIFPDSNTTAYSRFHTPYDGYIKEIIVHPHEAAASGTCTITPAIGGTGTTSVQETISATAGTPTTFTFGVAGYSFSDGDDIVLEFDRESNTRSKGFSFTIVFIMDTTS